jgi:hypothetical protein
MDPSSAESLSLAGLFASSFLSATLLPGNSEIVLVALLHQALALKWPALLVATIGNTLGGMTSYAIGRFFPKPREGRVVAWLKGYGPAALLLCGRRSSATRYALHRAGCGKTRLPPPCSSPSASSRDIGCWPRVSAGGEASSLSESYEIVDDGAQVGLGLRRTVLVEPRLPERRDETLEHGSLGKRVVGAHVGLVVVR